MTGRRNIPDERCIIASPRRGTEAAKKRLRRTKLSGTRYAEAAARGDPDIAVVFASEGIDLTHAIEPASVILAQVLEEAEATLARSFSTVV
jgi:hypothetical protein